MTARTALRALQQDYAWDDLDALVASPDLGALLTAAQKFSALAIVDPRQARSCASRVIEALSPQLARAGGVTTQLALASLLNGAACVGVLKDIPDSLVSSVGDTAEGRLVAIATGPTAPGPRLFDRTRTQFESLDDVSEHLAGAVATTDPSAAFSAWRWAKHRIRRGELQPTALAWIARVVFSRVCGRPVGEVGDAAHNSLVEDAAREAERDSRRADELRARLVSDPDRCAKDPTSRLAVWNTYLSFASLRDRLVEQLRDATDAQALRGLADALNRSILAAPSQRLDGAHGVVQCVLAAELEAASPACKLAALDIANALVCAGAPDSDALQARTRAWLPLLAELGPPLSIRARVAAAAIVNNDEEMFRRLVPKVSGDELEGGRSFAGNVLAFLDYVHAAVAKRAAPLVVDDAWHRLGEELDELCQTGQIDEATFLWLARVVLSRLDEEPVARVATRAHDQLWAVPSDLAAARREASQLDPAFPLGRTLAKGRIRVEGHLLGTGAQMLCRGDGVLISLDTYHPPRQRIEDLQRTITYQSDGLFELEFVGPLDQDATSHWAVVERTLPGSWLPHILGPADPWSGPKKAVELGLSAGRILATAAAAGILLTGVRPELMWARREGERLAVTGLSTRALELFRRSADDLVTRPIFDRWYHAPEWSDQPDDRALAYSLAVMIAEWTTGAYPFGFRYAPHGVELAAHEPIDAPAALKKLLENTIRRDRSQRPTLAELLDALERIV